ncbi:uncharacterized protein LOC128209049 [Mya arenaria]|uniref:uncharacterized protein LOC128209049 n=1 Tax=Mya arenaria TaxID=6604 RepID=UPI0022E84B35|nr:uncharacterized protein LOC128209049 [Mya arenaria]
MKLKDSVLSIQFIAVFKFQTPYKINCLRFGNAFRKDTSGLVVGGEDGIIRIYDLSSEIQPDKPQIFLETKGGPIQSIAIHDVTKFYNDDIVAGDSVGMVTIFCNRQILTRHSLSKNSIHCLNIHKNPLGNCAIVAADESGYICAIQPSQELWRINLNNLAINKGPSEKAIVTSLLCADLTTPSGEVCSYILAADNRKHLLVVNQGEVVMTINTPDVVTAMCSGAFIDAERLDTGGETTQTKNTTQVALGCASGAVYIMHNFTITEDEFVNAQYRIGQLLAHPCTTRDTDLILCAGHFSSLQVFHDGKKVGNYDTPDWIRTMDIMYTSGERKPQIVIGCLNNSVQGLSLLEGSS